MVDEGILDLVRSDPHLSPDFQQVFAYLSGCLCIEVAQSHSAQDLRIGLRDIDQMIKDIEVSFVSQLLQVQPTSNAQNTQWAHVLPVNLKEVDYTSYPI